MPYQPRVLLVIADSSRTGGPEHVLTLARELVGVGWQVAVAAPPGDLLERCQALGVSGLPLACSGRQLGLAPIRLRQLARRHHADLVHSHGLRAGWLVRRGRLQVPWVHTHHLDSWSTASPLRTAVHRRELRAIGRRAQLQIAVSQSVFQFITETVGSPASRVRVVPNGIDPLRPRLRQRPAAARAGVLASLIPSKGVDLAVMALATPLGRQLSLVVGGQGPELAALMDLAERLQVAPRVDFVGPVTDRQRFFDSCDVFWVPSRAEPFGLVACEAMSAGLPVVGARVGGLPEILDPPRSGALVAPANPTALASVTAALLADGDRYRRLSEAGP
jgi:glycosyltransferase involved in cell wall biosynthesis